MSSVAVDFTQIRRPNLKHLLKVYAGLQEFGGGYAAELRMIRAELDKKNRPVDEKPGKRLPKNRKSVLK